jgi:hypothetical protein
MGVHSRPITDGRADVSVDYPRSSSPADPERDLRSNRRAKYLNRLSMPGLRKRSQASVFGLSSACLMMVSVDYPEVFAMGLLSCYRTRDSGLNTFQSTTTTILRSPMTSCRRFGKRTSGSESQCWSIAAPGIGRSGKAVSYIKRGRDELFVSESLNRIQARGTNGGHHTAD